VSTWFASQEGNNEEDVEETGSDAGMDEAPAAQEPEQPAGLVMGGGRTLAGTSVPSASSSAQPPPTSGAQRNTQRGGMRTLKDLQGDGAHEGHGHGHGDDDDSDEEQDFFAGGEKSGLAVQNPNANPSSSARDHINSILERAKRLAREFSPPSISYWPGRAS
jgi:UBX domain-containing protein 1